MTLAELKTEIRKYQYLEDEGMIDVMLASVIATRLEYGRPVWMVLIGQSSGGKSQILRPIAMTDPKFIHELDDITENTFMSAMASKEGEMSLLKRIGSRGILAISDLTVLMSKGAEARAVILSQLRMVYDGRMTKHAGNKDQPIVWKGKMGVIAASTPSIYRHFEEVSDMGERFVYYRMKEHDTDKAMDISYGRGMDGEDLDIILSSLYSEYIKETCMGYKDTGLMNLDENVYKRLKKIATFAERIRTTADMEWRGRQIERIPVVASPVRVFNELVSLARGFMAMKIQLDEKDIETLEWCGYSLANDEKRACLKVLAGSDFERPLRTQTVGDAVGLATEIANTVLQVLAATKVLIREGDENGLKWRFRSREEWEIVRRMEGIEASQDITERALSQEESADLNAALNLELDIFAQKA